MRRTPIKKEIVFLFFALASLLATLAILFYLGRQSYGHLCIYVADAYTLSPLGGAVIVLPESGLQAETDEFGKADFFNVPVVKNRISTPAATAASMYTSNSAIEPGSAALSRPSVSLIRG